MRTTGDDLSATLSQADGAPQHREAVVKRKDQGRKQRSVAPRLGVQSDSRGRSHASRTVARASTSGEEWSNTFKPR